MSDETKNNESTPEEEPATPPEPAPQPEEKEGPTPLPIRLMLAVVNFFGLDKQMLVVAGVVFFITFVIGAYFGHSYYTYSWEDPAFCYSCHLHDYAVDEWKRSVHGEDTTCHDCHHEPLMHYMFTGMHTFIDRPSFPEDFEEPPHVKNELCENCHWSTLAGLEAFSGPMTLEKLDRAPKVDTTPYHRIHILTAAANIEQWLELAPDARVAGRENKEIDPRTSAVQCVDCHGAEANRDPATQRAHDFRAKTANCVACHKTIWGTTEEQTHDPLADLDCRHCHFEGFLLPAEELAPGWPPSSSPANQVAGAMDTVTASDTEHVTSTTVFRYPGVSAGSFTRPDDE